MKKTMGLVGSIVGLFVFSVLFFLFVNGMLIPKPPFVRAAKGYLAPDSLSATTGQEATQSPDDREGSLEDSLESPELSGTEVASAPDPLTEDTAPVLSQEDQVAAEGVTGRTNASAAGAATASANASASQEAKEAAAMVDASPFDPEKMSRLVRVYEKMRPKQVGLILDTMPDAQSVAVLGSMKDRAAAQVMAAMEPSKAARMSQMLVERSQ